jgi:hypothetical protein
MDIDQPVDDMDNPVDDNEGGEENENSEADPVEAQAMEAIDALQEETPDEHMDYVNDVIGQAMSDDEPEAIVSMAELLLDDFDAEDAGGEVEPGDDSGEVSMSVEETIDAGLERAFSEGSTDFRKGRRYIDDESEAPEDATVQEGSQGGLYYETGGGEDSSEEETEEDENDLSDMSQREQVQEIKDTLDPEPEEFESFADNAANRSQSAGQAYDEAYRDTQEQLQSMISQPYLFNDPDFPTFENVDFDAADEVAQEVAEEVAEMASDKYHESNEQ